MQLEIERIMKLPEVKDDLIKRSNPNNFDLYKVAFSDGGELGFYAERIRQKLLYVFEQEQRIVLRAAKAFELKMVRKRRESPAIEKQKRQDQHGRAKELRMTRRQSVSLIRAAQAARTGATVDGTDQTISTDSEEESQRAQEEHAGCKHHETSEDGAQRDSENGDDQQGRSSVAKIAQ